MSASSYVDINHASLWGRIRVDHVHRVVHFKHGPYDAQSPLVPVS